jgi:hypothetical protein
MKTRVLITFAIVLIIPITESFAEEIKIKFGETVQYENLNLYFYDVEDSRCPLDVTCIWEGKVSAMIHTSNQTHKIGGGLEIDHPRTYITPYIITLIDVKPHPISTEKPDYVAILDITKIDKNSNTIQVDFNESNDVDAPSNIIYTAKLSPNDTFLSCLNPWKSTHLVRYIGLYEYENKTYAEFWGLHPYTPPELFPCDMPRIIDSSLKIKYDIFLPGYEEFGFD